LNPPESFPLPAITVSDKIANRAVWGFSVFVFLVVVILNRVQLPSPEGFDVHIFAKVNAVINSLVTVLLVAGLLTAKTKKWSAHRSIMLSAIGLSALFLVSYITHHLFAGDTKFGGQGAIRWIYYAVLISHILLAAGSLPFILLTAYRSLAGHYDEHRKLAKKVWPIWLYVSASGVVVYWMISPYY
jgi:putative membrane protein